MRVQKKVAAAAAGLALLGAAGCRSHHVDVTVENRTGAEIRLLEVDYPNASFGKDSLQAGALMHYRIQLQGNGQVKVQYTAPSEKQVQLTGPSVSENQDGELRIVLGPNGKALFVPRLSGR